MRCPGRTLQPPLSCLALVVVLTLSCLSTSTALPPAAAEPNAAVLIVEYKPRAVAQALQSSGETSLATAAVSRAANEAAAAAESRGASPHRQQTVATIAADSVASAAAVAALTTSIVVAAQQAGVSITGLTNYHTVIHGAAIQTASARESAALRRILKYTPSVKRVHESATLSLVRPIRRRARAQSRRHRSSRRSNNNNGNEDFFDRSTSATSINPTAAQLHALTGVDKLRSQGLDGSGVLVCVVDTGINFKQAIYGQCSAVNAPDRTCKVVSGYNLVGDAYEGTRNGPGPVAGGQPTDCMGHGSMVASVVGTKNGVAPGITLGAYRVFGCDGYVGDNVLIEAIDKAVRDGCDVINLSLASGSGYADTSIYKQVMDNAIAKGVLMVKAAGNAGVEGPFRADVSTAVGAITVASVDAEGLGGSKAVKMSSFSSYGPDPTLDLLPHIAAPGGDIPVWTMDGNQDVASGTSFAAPYTSGVLAMWLQHKQQQAAALGEKLDPAAVSQDAAMRGLVATAVGVRDSHNSNFLEPVAWMGAGLIKASNFIKNQLSVSPMMLQLPTGLEEPYEASLSVTWDGPASPSGNVAYTIMHQPSASISLSDGWYGTGVSLKRAYVAAEVEFGAPQVVVDTNSGAAAVVKVTFTLPEGLKGKRLLYSGLIRLKPANNSSIPPISIPYQGFAAPLKALRLNARAAQNGADADALRKHANALCYSPRVIPSFYHEVMDHLAKVPDVCSGGFATTNGSVIPVDFETLRASSECSLRFTMAPEVPLERLQVQLLDDQGALLGSLEPLVPSSGGALAKPRQVMSYCTRFDGEYTDAKGRQQIVSVGSKYGFKVLLHGPVSLTDAALEVSPRVDEVIIKGLFKVTSSSSSHSTRASQNHHRNRNWS